MLKIDLSILWEIINVLILFVLVRKFLFKPVRKVLEARKADIKKQYDDAEAKNNEAKAIKEQCESDLAKMDETRAEAIAEAKKQADAEYSKIVDAAQEKAKVVIEEAQAKARSAAENEKRRAEDEIALMVKQAGERFEETRTSKSLYDDFLKKNGQDE